MAEDFFAEDFFAEDFEETRTGALKEDFEEDRTEVTEEALLLLLVCTVEGV